VCPDAGRGRRWAPAFPDRVLPPALAHRTNPTVEQRAALFGISDSAVHRVIDRPAPHLADLLGPHRPTAGSCGSSTAPSSPSTTRPAPRNRSTTAAASTPNRLRARDRRIVAASEAWPGNHNDTIVFEETLGNTLPDHPRLIGDGGYRGNPRVTSPRRGPDGRIIKDRNHRRFRERRARAEHTIARLEDHQILRQCRRRGPAIDHAIAGVATLHNLKLETA
jgi:hypothetical protein